MSDWQIGYAAGWKDGRESVRSITLSTHPVGKRLVPRKPAKKPRKASAANKRYGKAFKRLAPKFKKKSGGWKKNGFKRCAAAARKAAKK